jgi:uncharacterized protein
MKVLPARFFLSCPFSRGSASNFGQDIFCNLGKIYIYYRIILGGAAMLPKRPLGSTGSSVTRLGLGGQITVEYADQAIDAEAIIHRALDLGINYIDTSPRYGDTASETNIGRVMAQRRNEVFLATKTKERTYSGVMHQVEESLQRLQTDHLDLYQIHNLRVEEELRTILALDGAMRAFTELKEQGIIRFAGVTGHKDPALMKKAIASYPFDTILMPMNVGDVYHASFQDGVLPAAVSRKMGIIGMKVTAKGRLTPGADFTMQELLGYVLTLPVTTAIVGIGTLEELEENVKIVQAFAPFSDDTMSLLEKRAAPMAYPANFFKHEW